MKTICCIFILLFTNSLLSQSSIELNFSDVCIGRNINMNWKKTISNFSISTGLTYHINSIDKVPIGILIKNSALSQNFGEKFGIQLGFEYFLLENSFCKVGLFYNNQTSFISQILKIYPAHSPLVSNPQSEEDYLYTKSERVFGPVLTIDNVIGLTLNNKLTEKFYLTTKAGLGWMYWKNTDNSILLIVGKKNNQSYNFTSFFNIGLGYTFKNKKLITTPKRT